MNYAVSCETRHGYAEFAVCGYVADKEFGDRSFLSKMEGAALYQTLESTMIGRFRVDLSVVDCSFDWLEVLDFLLQLDLTEQIDSESWSMSI